MHEVLLLSGPKTSPGLWTRLGALALLSAAAAYSSLSFATAKKTEKVALDVQEQKHVKQDRPAATTRITRNEAFIIATETRLLSVIEQAIDVLAKNAARLPKKSTSRLDMRERQLADDELAAPDPDAEADEEDPERALRPHRSSTTTGISRSVRP